ncbi:hypothetical protein COL30_29840 [Bacillus pseudomycoides]|nr:hypothetical protein COO19_28520 [Bacillus pseudomycoides]PEI87471.1 hypothetical protein CN686_27160 [Bacillus pseudomycoides]PEK07720.1 hypothetical protein CN693_28750 [Bacillus pseudomycoides]PEM71298.1 hypothetical protein CN619_18790 [Bacillus pseudomycoides]PEO08162.1 hypothetical protein CN542_25765 [Bacillus pseudomycoides]
MQSMYEQGCNGEPTVIIIEGDRMSKNNIESSDYIDEEITNQYMNVFKEMVSLYQERYKRLPTIQEIEKILTNSFQFQQFIDFKKETGLEISDVKIKTKKAQKTQSFKLGDVIAIPLNRGELYGYGMILTGGPKKSDADTYIKFFDMFTPKIMNVIEFKRMISDELFILNCAFGSITSGEWRIIGGLPYKPQGFKIPNFLQELYPGEYYVVFEGDISQRRIATKEEITKLSPFGIMGNAAIEEMLYSHYLKKSN